MKKLKIYQSLARKRHLDLFLFLIKKTFFGHTLQHVGS